MRRELQGARNLLQGEIGTSNPTMPPKRHAEISLLTEHEDALGVGVDDVDEPGVARVEPDELGQGLEQRLRGVQA